MENIVEEAVKLLKGYPFGFDDRSKIIGDIFSLSDFITMTEDYSIIDDDGCIGCVLVDERATTIKVLEWDGCYGGSYDMTLEDLKNIHGKVEIEWCNR